MPLMNEAGMAWRIGQGYDIHRLAPNLPFWLGGVLLESATVGCVAHSDGDVVLHALIDALLGACALGDIGDHFPPSNPQYKAMRSPIMLAQVVDWVAQTGYRPQQLDCTIMLEAPKLGPYKATIKTTLAQLLDLCPDRVNVKAKTAEGLGAIGAQQAVAASVSVLLGVCTDVL
jgi:2-C-methyl-D-erythritol 2,4-cyclodiphosphate synthase